MNHVMAEIELESFVRMISINCKLFEITDAGSVPGCKEEISKNFLDLSDPMMTHDHKRQKAFRQNCVAEQEDQREVSGADDNSFPVDLLAEEQHNSDQNIVLND